MESPSAAELAGPPGESSAEVREKVCLARQLQAARLGKGRCNSDVAYPDLKSQLDSGAEMMLGSLLPRIGLRGVDLGRLLRVAQTIADLDCEGEIGRHHLEEALSLTRS